MERHAYEMHAFEMSVYEMHAMYSTNAKVSPDRHFYTKTITFSKDIFFQPGRQVFVKISSRMEVCFARYSASLDYVSSIVMGWLRHLWLLVVAG
jgi:hypothetical protein